MKFGPFTSSGNASSSVSKPRQQLMQTLEPRRLMSLTGAPDFAPPVETPTQFTHSFGFENLLPPPPGFGQGPAPFASIASSNNIADDATESTTSVARASAQAATITTTADNTAVPTPAPAASNSLSAMYAALNNSTVAAIDEANAADARKSFITAIAAAPNPIQNPNSTTGNTPAEIVVVERSGSTPATSAAAVGDTVPAPFALPATPALAASSPSENLVPQTSFSRTLENELQSVSALAREMVSQLGRNLAIELAHIESAADSAVIAQLNAPWDGWRIAAVAGAAIATAAYLQSEAKSDGSKPKSVFSDRMIESVAT
jgi:hypothetical protein